MSASNLDDLMLEWEAARDAGKRTTPENLCASCPQLADELRQRIRAIEEMEAILGVNGHESEQTEATDGLLVYDPALDVLPTIPGYEIIRVVDQGGMGIVYEARQTNLGRTVAIKMISSLRLGRSLLARFRAEAEASARLQHPNFVQIFEVGQVAGRPFFSMEYVGGGSLADQLARQRPDARAAAELVETLARAMQTAHESGIVHRDLKPSNVMLAADGTPKIADFGLAKRLGEHSNHTQSGEILGTPSYMAPEQAAGKRDAIGPGTDVYSLGAILYELLAGQPPFRGASALDSLRLLTTQEPVPPSRLATHVPPDLEAICLKCLEKTPSRRYPSGRELADDLRRYLNGQPVTARRLGTLRKTWKWLRRHRQSVALAVALVLLTSVPIFLFMDDMRAQREVRRAQREIQLKAVQQAPLVREILQRNCYECHGRDPKKVTKNLNILIHDLLLDAKRRLIVPGAPGDSRLIQRIADGSMPPEEEELRLPRVTESELDVLRDWVLGGAPPLPLDDVERPAVIPYSPLAGKVKAIFHEHCYECHKYDVKEGGIKIMDYRLLVTVRKVVIPGRPDESELYHLITSTDDATRMPQPPAQPLSAQDIATIRQWIQEGAPPLPRTD